MLIIVLSFFFILKFTSQHLDRYEKRIPVVQKEGST